MQASNFGHTAVVELLLAAADNPVDLDAVNIRGQRAEEVAVSRGHDAIADMIARFASIITIMQFIYITVYPVPKSSVHRG